MICYSYICAFAALINKVSLKVTVEGLIGDSVLLPCSSDDHDHKLQEVDVSWRHNGSKIVFDLIPHINSLEKQDPRYKGRAETFPKEYLRRNFSIKLSALTHTDAGKYICYITPSDEQKTVELIINEPVPVTEKENKTTDPDNKEETIPESVEKPWPWILTGILLLILIILISVIIFRRKISSQIMSGEHGSDAHEIVSPGPGYKSVIADDGDEAAKAGE